MESSQGRGYARGDGRAILSIFFVFLCLVFRFSVVSNEKKQAGRSLLGFPRRWFVGGVAAQGCGRGVGVRRWCYQWMDAVGGACGTSLGFPEMAGVIYSNFTGRRWLHNEPVGTPVLVGRRRGCRCRALNANAM
jgi:hypothetical protein